MNANVNQDRLPRRWSKEGFWPFRLEALSPIFIGSGETLSPLDYVIKDQKIYLVDSETWLAKNYNKNRELNQALESGDLRALRRLIARDLDPELYGLGQIEICCSELAENLRTNISKPNSHSKVEVRSFVRNPLTYTPFIPGSSLKGAISTPLIDYLNQPERCKGRPLKDNYKERLKDFLGPITTHTMQGLKLADLPIAPGVTKLYRPQEIKLHHDPHKTATPKDPCEALPPLSKLYGSLQLDYRRAEMALELPDGQKISWPELRQICNEFYKKRFEDEWNKFYQILPQAQPVRETMAPVRERLGKLKKEELLLRLGRYSHIECVTVSDNDPQHRKGCGRTRTLADGLRPFGWVILSPCTETEYRQGLAKLAEALTEARIERARKYAGRAQIKDERQERAANQSFAVFEPPVQPEEVSAAISLPEPETLTPLERLMRLLSAPGAAHDIKSEGKASELYNMLDSLQNNERSEAAQVLKDYWFSINKWEGKLSKKQKDKVDKVKKILGL